MSLLLLLLQLLQEDTRLLHIIHVEQKLNPEQDNVLAVNWLEIAQALGGGRTGKQCRDRWHNNLRPGIKKGGWTTSEEALIGELHENFGPR